MNAELMQQFWAFGIFTAILFIMGIYCIVVSFNLVRALLGLEIMIKSATLLVIVAGYVSGHAALAQSIVITMIVVEVVAITIAVGIVLGIRSHNNSLDVRRLPDVKEKK